MLTDTSVGEYLGLTSEQVRILRLYKDIHQCAACADVHPSFPSIRIYHSPCCKAQGKCRTCGAGLGEVKGHEVGALCAKCAYGE